ELFAYAHTDFIRAVCNHADADLLRASQRAANGSRQFEPVTKIAVTACRRNHGTGRENARTCYNALIDCLLEAEHGTAHVPNGGEASHQRVRGLGAGYKIDVPDVRREKLSGGRPHQHWMPVHVNQPGHQCATTAVNDYRVGFPIDWQRCD